MNIQENDLHPHIRARMNQRGVTIEEMNRVLNEGWETENAKQGTIGKALVFPYNQLWEGNMFPEKEVTVYYKIANGEVIPLTVLARYGTAFTRKEF